MVGRNKVITSTSYVPTTFWRPNIKKKIFLLGEYTSYYITPNKDYEIVGLWDYVRYISYEIVHLQSGGTLLV